MRKLILLAVVSGGLFAGDLAAKSYVEGKVADRFEAAVAGDQRADVTIRSFPFVARLLLNGSAGDMRAHLTVVEAGGLRLSDVQIDLDGVRVDRDQLRQREVEVRSIESGTVTAHLRAEAISEVLRVPVEIRDGKVEATVAGQTVTAEASAVENRLRLAVGVLPTLTVPIPKSSVVPCATSGEVLEDRIRLTCRLDEVPPALVRAANRAGSGRGG